MPEEASRAPVHAVYDTNVLFSAIYGYRRARVTPPVLCWDAVLDGAVELAISPQILDELLAALSRKDGLSIALAAEAVELVSAVAHLVTTPGKLSVLKRDPADNRVLECAVLSGATFLVTGNLEHFAELGSEASGPQHRGVEILSPRTFIARLEPQLPRDHPFRERLG
ncbi:MAG: PIN domain-containing protein [Gemmatimonadota bacterium]